MLTRRLRAVICFRTDWGCALSFDGGACQAGASREPRPYRTTITGRSWIYPAGGMLGIFIHFGVRFCQFFLEMYSFRVSYSHRADITPHSVAGQMGQKMRARKSAVRKLYTTPDYWQKPMPKWMILPSCSEASAARSTTWKSAAACARRAPPFPDCCFTTRNPSGNVSFHLPFHGKPTHTKCRR